MQILGKRGQLKNMLRCGASLPWRLEGQTLLAGNRVLGIMASPEIAEMILLMLEIMEEKKKS